MFARIEVAGLPYLSDAPAQSFLRRIEIAHPPIRAQIRWARFLDVYWIDIPSSREELIPAISQVCWDPVLQWMFTGNLIPSAAGKTGGLFDLMEHAPNRPGKFWGMERRFRQGVTDAAGKTLLEAFEIVLGRKFPEARASSGGLWIIEGTDLDEDTLAGLARDVFCNETVETWTLITEEGLKQNDRFHQERVKHDLPRLMPRGSDRVETIELEGLSDDALQELSRKKLWALSLEEMKAIRSYFSSHEEKELRETLGLGAPTDVELEMIAQTWSEYYKHKIFNAKICYSESEKTSVKIPNKIDGLFKCTISSTTSEVSQPWLLSVLEGHAGICAFDEEDAFCIKVEAHDSPSALDPYGGALTGMMGVNRDILGCGLGAKPLFNTHVLCVAPSDYTESLPDRILHPRRILDGVRQGVEHGGSKSGIPILNGALVFDVRYLGKPLVYCGSAGIMPRKSVGIPCETKQIAPGDRICMVGGRIGKDGIHGATFSSLALDESSLLAAVQLGDPIHQKRMSDFLLEARDLGLYRAITGNGAGGLSASVGELARLSNGAWMDVSLAQVKYPGLKPYERLISESQERMTVAVAPEKLAAFLSLADRRSVEVSPLGEFRQSGRFEVAYEGKRVASIDLEFLHHGVPRLELEAKWTPLLPLEKSSSEAIQPLAGQILLSLLGRPNIASKEWLIRQYDHEVQGMSVIKPLHTTCPGTPHSLSGPNDAGVIKPKSNSDVGLAVGCGIHPLLSAIDPWIMAQAAVDEAVRNVLCVGAEFGLPESLLALVHNFCWPDPVGDPLQTAGLVRACYGMREAALALSTPFISGKESMKNDFRGKQGGESVLISIPPTLLITALAKVKDIKCARSADFKSVGDCIYLLGPGKFGLLGSEFHSIAPQWGNVRVGTPDWKTALLVYRWLGGATGKSQTRLKSVHDISEGGLLVAVAECLLGRGFGAVLTVPENFHSWEFLFGEGFHSFVATTSTDDKNAMESEWRDLGIPFIYLGVVENQDSLEVYSENSPEPSISVELKKIRSAWMKEGYWE